MPAAGTAKNSVLLFFAIPFISLFCQVLRRKEEWYNTRGWFYVTSHRTPRECAAKRLSEGNSLFW
jgi:hypothetical protein